MRKLLFSIEDRVCDECALALRRFIGHLSGIDSIDVENREIAVSYDPTKVTDEGVLRVITESLEKLGHKPLEHWHLAEM